VLAFDSDKLRCVLVCDGRRNLLTLFLEVEGGSLIQLVKDDRIADEDHVDMDVPESGRADSGRTVDEHEFAVLLSILAVYSKVIPRL
jgi:hypothetical protein